MKMTLNGAVSHIEKHGMLLVFPLANRAEPLSLWSSFFPRSKMKWEWDSGGDDRVASLWHLREELSRSARVVYAKWFRGRATFFSKELFVAALAYLWFQPPQAEATMGRTAREVLAALELNSPLSTKELKAETELKGRDNEPDYQRALKELWERLLIVGYGEKDDGAFPSLRLGATATLFEGLWNRAAACDGVKAEKILKNRLGEESLFYQQLKKVRGKLLV